MFAKVHEQIFSSSIMEEDVAIRYVWFCFLVLADKDGTIDMTIPAIARRINIDEDLVKKAIEKFVMPDEKSRTPDCDGRRIEPIRESFGWRVINKSYYDSLRSEAERRAYMRNYMSNKRKKAGAGVGATVGAAIGAEVGTETTAKAREDVNTSLAMLAHTDVDVDIYNIYRALFEELWTKYPNKDGKKEAFRHFMASVITDKDMIDIRQALSNYLDCKKAKAGYVKDGKTWFNNWRDWIDFKDPVKLDQQPSKLCKCGDVLFPKGIRVTTYKLESGEEICYKCENKRLRKLEEDDYEE